MNKTKIDWADSTWNPVTGCQNECPYCYARKIATRFAGTKAYPNGFSPTFRRERLEEPARVKKPQNIFVGSMCDLFGDWVPYQWIASVFNECENAPQHRYLFLTKNPSRYKQLIYSGILKSHANWWLGYTATNNKDLDLWFEANTIYLEGCNTFLSVEPIHERVGMYKFYGFDWVIIGAETGNRKEKIVPEKEWIDQFSKGCFAGCVPLFMKESLRELMGSDFKQEYPWGDTP